MNHNIPIQHVQKHTRGVSDAKRIEVANLQNHIQELLGDTHHTFLQGSYANDTSTSDINDVDIVAIRKNTYSSVHSGVPCVSVVMWETIFSEIERKLRNQNRYRWSIARSHSGKCLEISTTNLKADVVPAVQVNCDITVDPIVIYCLDTSVEKINCPRDHKNNGAIKHQQTDQNFKPVVRMFKNWANNHFNNGVVSSYQIESLVYGVPNDEFVDDHAASFILSAKHIGDLLERRESTIFRIPSVCGVDDVVANWNLANRQLFRQKLQESFSHGLLAYRANSDNEALHHWNNAFNI